MALQYPGISYLKGYDGKISDILDQWLTGVEAGRNDRDEANAGDLIAKLFSAQGGSQQPLGGTPLNAAGMGNDGIVNGSHQAVANAEDPMLASYFANTRRAESGGNDSARNPNSSATGRYQFIDSTWQGLMDSHPELGLTPDGRNDPAQQERAMKAFTMDNARQLKGAGVGINPGSLYAAHFLGAGGASKVLAADPNTPVASLVGPEVVQANPQLANMTVGQFQEWAASKGGNGSGGYAGPTLPTPTTGGIDPQLVKELFANRATRPLVADLFKNQTAANKPTDDIAEYTFALGQGYRGTFEEWQKTNKAGVTVNTGDNSGAFAKKADETAATRMSDYVTAGNDATNFVGDLQTLGAISQNLETGKGAEVLAALGPFAEMAGIDIAGLGEAQAYDAIISRMAPAMRIPGSGASSDFDARQFLKSLPALGKSPEGNQIVIDTFQGIQQRKIAAAEIAQQALTNQITWQEADKQIAALGDPYSAFNEYRRRVETPKSDAPAAEANDQQMPASYDGDPALWQYLTPEEKALWR